MMTDSDAPLTLGTVEQKLKSNCMKQWCLNHLFSFQKHA